MRIDKWVSGYKVDACPWIDHETIHFCVAYYKPGQSIQQPPVWEKTVYVTDNENGRRMLAERLHSFVEFVARTEFSSDPRAAKVVITA